MNEFFSKAQVDFQQRNDTTRIASQLRDTRMHSKFTDDDRSVIEPSLFFFLSTSSSDGMLDCSFKGGDTGFVKVLRDDLLVFANYDGNGMYRSLGNISENPSVALLFIQFDGNKRRVRLNGLASISYDKHYVREFPLAECVVLVKPTHIFPNCPRNIPTLEFKEKSIYCPSEGYRPPEPYWKSKPDLKEFLSHKKSYNTSE
jgi:hypothetical protein